MTANDPSMAPLRTAAIKKIERNRPMTLPHSLLAIAGILAALFLAACGSGPGGAAQPDPSTTPGADLQPAPDATPPRATDQGSAIEAAASGGLCDLLPADQASEILGVPVLPGVAKTSVVFGGSSCRYVAADSTDSVGIQYTAGTVRDEWETQLAKIRITAEMAVVGLGDAAYRYDGSTSRPGVRLAVFEGDHDIWVVIDSPADNAAIVAAAERVAHRLLDALN